ncbi:ATP-NAD kinase family protein [Paucibacter soli]|uniref:ATP-NAD kinase family protein n=1 Tax=Paucibacter soli TaxID=3133433 RepID=UPI0030B16B10
MRVGLIINPIAGAGGPLAQHGSDAYRPGAEPPAWAAQRAEEALRLLLLASCQPDWVCGAGAMGEDLLRALGQAPELLGERRWPSSAQQTREIAAQMLAQDLTLLLFAGGDGTARDVHDAVGEALPVLGIPAGVKLQSACFGVSPRAAGALAASYLMRHARVSEAREVLDLDERALAQGRVQAQLYGLLRVPVDARLLQGRKARSEAGDALDAQRLAESLKPQLQQGLHFIGPGSTTWALKQALGLDGSLIGVDVVADGALWLRDATEAQLWELAQQQRQPRLWLTAIGGQGHVLGRGNAPLSPRVLQALGRAALTLLITPRKLQALGGVPLRVDCGAAAVDALYAGPVRAMTGPREQAMLRLVAA